jgi:anion-transporting  ArsA/GET3 family ATPase
MTNPDSLTSLRFVAGKGGVGRTSVAAALAADAAARGRRVLAVDALGTGELQRVIDTARRSGSAAAGLDGDLSILRLTTAEALDQYLNLFLRIPGRSLVLGASTKVGPLARAFDYVSNAAPGVREILVIGKIGYEVGIGEWDEVVVDGPATGHVVELLDAPRVMADLVPSGPIADQTDWLRRLLARPDRTEVVVVTTPDELAVAESIELVERLRATTETPVGSILVNRVPPRVGPSGQREINQLVAAGSPLADVAALAGRRHLDATDRLAQLDGLGLARRDAIEDWGDPLAAIGRAWSGGVVGDSGG